VCFFMYFIVHAAFVRIKLMMMMMISVKRTVLLGVTADALRANIGSKSATSLQRGPVDPKFQVEWVAPPTNHSYSQKTRINYLSYGIKNLDKSFFRFVTIHAFDRQTEFSSLDRVCIRCSAVKEENKKTVTF